MGICEGKVSRNVQDNDYKTLQEGCLSVGDNELELAEAQGGIRLYSKIFLQLRDGYKDGFPVFWWVVNNAQFL